MALLIKLEEDGGLTLLSDDAEAENMRVEDAFRGGCDDFIDSDEEDDPDLYPMPPVAYEVLSAWEEAPFTDTMQVTYGPEHSEEIIEALEAVGFHIPEDILNAVFPPKGKPKSV